MVLSRHSSSHTQKRLPLSPVRHDGPWKGLNNVVATILNIFHVLGDRFALLGAGGSLARASALLGGGRASIVVGLALGGTGRSSGAALGRVVRAILEIGSLIETMPELGPGSS